MLNKCSNPSCSSRFHSLRQGKLFRVETQQFDPTFVVDGERDFAACSPRRVEYFWLCEDCSPFLTLAYDAQAGLTTIPLHANSLESSVPDAEQPVGRARPSLRP
jgi:hypothetical protein